MKSKTIIILVLIILIGGGFFLVGQKSSENNAVNSPQADVMEMNKDSVSEETVPAENPEESRYILYSKDAYDQSVEQKRVLYFYANWCPTCKVANAEFTQKTEEIPEDITILRINYNDSDTDNEEKELAKKYGVTYQHTFVQVDKDGEQITTWNGGGLTELVSRVE